MLDKHAYKQILLTEAQKAINEKIRFLNRIEFVKGMTKLYKQKLTYYMVR